MWIVWVVVGGLVLLAFAWIALHTALNLQDLVRGAPG
jgi:hypothetical protein